MVAHSGLITVMQRAARKAAPRLRRDFGEVEQLQVSRKGPADFVSMADKRAEATIVEADAVVKGQTASSSYKPAVLDNGVKVLVPPHITAGTKIVVDVYNREYVRRAD